MKIPKLITQFSSSCRVTQTQAEVLDQFSTALKAFCEDRAEIPIAVVGTGLDALSQIADSTGEEEGSVSWRAFRMEAATEMGSGIVVTNNSGDELSLQLDNSGQAYTGIYTHYGREGEIGHVLAFDLKSTSKGRLFRLFFEEKTTEIILGDDDAEGLLWTNQPDFGEEIEMDALAEDDYSEVTAAIDEETEGSAPLAVEAVKTESDELDDENGDHIIKADLREEKTMRENSNLPPKPPPIRRLDSPGQQPPPRYRQPPPPVPHQQSNTLALISLIAGISSVALLLLSICTWCLGVIPLLIGIGAAVLGVISKRQIDQSQGLQTGRKMAVAGIVLGVVGAVLSLVFMLIGLLVVGFAGFMDFL